MRVRAGEGVRESPLCGSGIGVLQGRNKEGRACATRQRWRETRGHACIDATALSWHVVFVSPESAFSPSSFPRSLVLSHAMSTLSSFDYCRSSRRCRLLSQLSLLSPINLPEGPCTSCDERRHDRGHTRALSSMRIRWLRGFPARLAWFSPRCSFPGRTTG